jgi:hypothetical protein
MLKHEMEDIHVSPPQGSNLQGTPLVLELVSAVVHD